MSLAGNIAPGCGCLGCASSAQVVIRHPDHGRRTVCWDHAEDYPVVETVAGGHR